MGAGSGGVSSVQNIANGQTVSIPLPTDGSLINSVLLFNYSPFLVQVSLGTSNAWLGAWMVDRFTLANVSGVKATAIQPVGGAANSSTGSITAAFVLEGDDLTDVGTYPAPLFHLAQQLQIVYPDGDPAVQIGPGQLIEMLADVTGTVTSMWTPSIFEYINNNNTGRIRVLPNGDPTTGNFPGIYFDTANTPGNYPNTAWIQANPDSAGNPQLGLNSGPYTDDSGLHNARGRLFFGSKVAALAQIDTGTQAEIGGSFEAWDNQAIIRYTDPTNTANSVSLVINGLNNAFMATPLQRDTGWTNLSPANGWSSAGAPNPPWSCRRTSAGTLMFRGTLTGGTRADGTQIGTLPAGYFDSTRQYFPFIGYTFPGAAARLVIDTSGNITIDGMSGGVGFIQFDDFAIPII